MMRTAAPLSAALVIWLGMLLWGGLGHPLDMRLHAQFHAGNNADILRWMTFVTHLGGWKVLTAITLAAAVWIYAKRRIRVVVLLITVFGGRMFVELQKALFGRIRPADEAHLVTVDSFSFPSGHAANALITYLAIALLIPVGRAWRATAVSIAFLIAAAVGVSRVVLGVHWPSDVIGGWAFALFWVALCMRLASERPDAPEPPRRRFMRRKKDAS